MYTKSSSGSGVIASLASRKGAEAADVEELLFWTVSPVRLSFSGFVCLKFVSVFHLEHF